GFPEVQAQAKRPLKDVAAVNATRWALFNRTQRGLPKAHWIDAACVGHSTPENLDTTKITPLRIKAVGHNSRQMCRMDKYGFPRTSAKASRTVKGFRTGDLVKAVVPNGKKRGVHVGKVAVRSSGSFNIVTARGTTQGISYRHYRSLHRA